ncbi:MAG: PspC domain-containing protein [Dysgonomonas sp.]
MKKVIDINIGGTNFAMEDDAFIRLKTYLSKFEATISNPEDVKEVMEDIELRVAEIFQKELKNSNQVIGEALVDKVIECLGEVDEMPRGKSENTGNTPPFESATLNKRLYRDVDDKKIAGICSGVAAYFNVDVTLVRVLFLVAVVCYSTGFWLYIILWIAVPEAITISQKLQMRGIPVTAENIRKYSSTFGK